MDNENTQLSDINVGNLDFQPISKRFMVWDKKEQRWYDEAFALRTDGAVKYKGVIDYGWQDRFIICQSTNLFDKDGKEIFEGHLVRWNGDVGIVEQYNGKWTFHIVTPAFAVYHELGPNSDMVKVIGHILSNPELLVEGE